VLFKNLLLMSLVGLIIFGCMMLGCSINGTATNQKKNDEQASLKLDFSKISLALEYAYSEAKFTTLAFSSQENLVAIGTDNSSVILLDIKNNNIIKKLTARYKNVRALSFSSDSANIYVVSEDSNSVNITSYDISSLAAHSISTRLKNNKNNVDFKHIFSVNGSYLALCIEYSNNHYSYELYDMTKKSQMGDVKDLATSRLWFSADEKYYYYRESNTRYISVSIADLKQNVLYDVEPRCTIPLNSTLKISPNNQLIAVDIFCSGALKRPIISIASREVLTYLTYNIYTDFDFSLDSNYLIDGFLHKNIAIHIWGLPDGEFVNSIDSEISGYGIGIKISRSNKYIGIFDENIIKIYSIGSAKLVDNLSYDLALGTNLSKAIYNFGGNEQSLIHSYSNYKKNCSNDEIKRLNVFYNCLISLKNRSLEELKKSFGEDIKYFSYNEIAAHICTTSSPKKIDINMSFIPDFIIFKKGFSEKCAQEINKYF
jgi:hypothetical protein